MPTWSSTKRCWEWLDSFQSKYAHINLRLNTRKHKEWFDENDGKIQKPLCDKCDTYRVCQQQNCSASKNSAYYTIKCKLKAKLIEMQGSWLNKKGKGIQQCADS